MSRQCRDPKCIINKEKLTVHKYKNKEKDPRPSSHRNSLSNSPLPQNEKQKCTKSKSKHSEDSPKSSKTLFNESKGCKNKKCHVSQSTSASSILKRLRQKLRMKSMKSTTFGRIFSSSQNYTQQTCTCGKSERREHANSQNVSTERSKRRKKSRRRRKKTSKRESDQLRHGCFTTLCVCVRGRSSNKLRACKCMLSREILSSDHECCCVKDIRKKRTNRSKSTLRNDIQTGRHTADPSASERKHPDELLQEKTNEERNVIIKGLDTLRKIINRFGTHTIKIFKSES